MPTSEPIPLAEVEHLIFGSYPIRTVLEHVSDPSWQSVRLSMMGKDTRTKIKILESYMAQATADDRTHREICVTNYVYALKRGGLVR